MLSKIITAGLNGIEGYPVIVETDTSRGLPSFSVVGLPSVTVREAKERVRAAILNCGFEFPMMRLTINLSPAGSRKEGSYFDLPMAVGVMTATGQIEEEAVQGIGFLGELALDGQVKGIEGAMPLVAGLVKNGVNKIFVPRENFEETSLIQDARLCPVERFQDVAAILTGEKRLSDEKLFCNSGKRIASYYDKDFSEVKGQEPAKRAITISVAGGHGLYLHGFPGSGKSMLAKRIPTIMPPMTYDEIIETTMIYSIAGKLPKDNPVITERPFCSPHHSITRAALIGGGNSPKPGEVSLAHRGVLFLDEFPEFSRETLEALRQPMEDGVVAIQRSESKVLFPCDFILVAAGNPCKCGYFGSNHKECKCGMGDIIRYQSKLSGPIMDRIDLQISVKELNVESLLSPQGRRGKEECASTEKMRKIVVNAREVQRQRYNSDIILNGRIEEKEIEKYCILTKNATNLLLRANKASYLSMRGYSKVIKIARTIADIYQTELIEEEHIAEALRYRELDRL